VTQHHARAREALDLVEGAGAGAEYELHTLS
jgi:hypothetical protein